MTTSPRQTFASDNPASPSLPFLRERALSLPAIATAEPLVQQQLQTNPIPTYDPGNSVPSTPIFANSFPNEFNNYIGLSSYASSPELLARMVPPAAGGGGFLDPTTLQFYLPPTPASAYKHKSLYLNFVASKRAIYRKLITSQPLTLNESRTWNATWDERLRSALTMTKRRQKSLGTRVKHLSNDKEREKLRGLTNKSIEHRHASASHVEAVPALQASAVLTNVDPFAQQLQQQQLQQQQPPQLRRANSTGPKTPRRRASVANVTVGPEAQGSPQSNLHSRRRMSERLENSRRREIVGLAAEEMFGLRRPASPIELDIDGDVMMSNCHSWNTYSFLSPSPFPHTSSLL